MKKDGQYVGIQDEYVPENDGYVDNKINDSLKGQFTNYVTDKDNQEKIKRGAKKGLKYAKRFGIGYLIFFILMFVFVFGMAIFIFVKVIGTSGRMHSEYKNQQAQHEITYFNQDFDWYEGTQSGSEVNSLLTKVTKSLKTNKEHIISVSYNGATTSNPDEITALKKQFDDFKKYEISMDYDSKGYINKITITDY